MFVGVGASRVRDLFEQAKANAPAIVFVDEIDAVGRHRGAGLGGGHDEREQTLNQLLVEMDGFDVKGGVILIAATNRPDILDPALLRPGRFDRQIAVERPDLQGRGQILKVHAKGKPIAPEASTSMAVARRTPGLHRCRPGERPQRGGAADRARRQEAHRRRRAGRGDRPRGRRPAEAHPADEREGEEDHRVPRGRSRPGRGGAAATPTRCTRSRSCPRGRALGYTMVLPDEDKYSTTRNEMLDQLAYMLGGRAAEEMVFHDPTTGAANDIEKATGRGPGDGHAVRHDRAARCDQARPGRTARCSSAATWATSATTPRRSPASSTKRSSASSRPRTTRPGRSWSRTATSSTSSCSSPAREGDARQERGRRDLRATSGGVRRARRGPVRASACPPTAARS